MQAEDRVRHDRGNGLLAALPPSAWSAVRPHLEITELRSLELLCERDKLSRYAHFPLRGTVVSLSVGEKQRRADAATIGAEGVVNGIISRTQNPSYMNATVQIGGECVRIPVTTLGQLTERLPALRDVLARYADALLAQLLQALVCNMVHSVEERFARWLLATHDRMVTDEVPLTQEIVAQMLGVHRATIIRIAQQFQEAGMIEYARGRISISRRSDLEHTSCECYAAVTRHYGRVLREAGWPPRNKTRRKS